MAPAFHWARYSDHPFSHAWLPRVFPNDTNNRILEWLEQDLPWKFTETDFYRQFEFSLRDVEPPAELDCVCAQPTIEAISMWMQERFAAPKLQLADVVAHRLESGQGIGVHNDYIPGGESHRLLILLGRMPAGGIIALCQNQHADSVQRLIQPVHGTGIAFPISTASYHAVSKVRAGKRFSLVYSFRPANDT